MPRPELLPLFPLQLVLLPAAVLPLHIFEERYKAMITVCLREERSFGVVWAQDDGIARVGCSAVVDRVLKRYEDGRMDILVHGSERFAILSVDSASEAFLQGRVEFFHDEGEAETFSAELRGKVAELHGKILQLLQAEPPSEPSDAEASGTPENEEATIETVYIDPETLGEMDAAFIMADQLPGEWELKQRLLLARSPQDRLRLLLQHYNALLPRLLGKEHIEKVAGLNGHGRLAP